MSEQTLICLLVFLGLFAASITMQWVRARKRRRLVWSVDPAFLAAADQEKWFSVERSFDFMKLQLVKKNLDQLSGEIKAEYVRYRRFSRAEILVTVSMLTFAATAYRICN
jgi:hypothetical protein